MSSAFTKTRTMLRSEWQAYRAVVQSLVGCLNDAPWSGYAAGGALLCGSKLLPRSIEEFQVVLFFTGPHPISDPPPAGHPIRITRQRGDFSRLSVDE